MAVKKEKKQSVSEVIAEFNKAPIVKNIAKTFPGTKIVLTDKQYEELALDMLRALRQLVLLNKGKNITLTKLKKDMLSIVIEGLKAVQRINTV